jgi:hypothetical protein
VHEEKAAVDPVDVLAAQWVVFEAGLDEGDVGSVCQIGAGDAQLVW